MKRNSILLLILGLPLVAGLLASTGTPAPAPALNSDLLAYWDFNEGSGSLLTDYSGRNRHGRLAGFGSSSWIQGPAANSTVADRALDLAYANRAITFAQPTKEQLRQFSLALWLRPSAVDQSTNPQRVVGSQAATGPVLTVLDNGTVQFKLKGQPQPLLMSAAPLIANAWQHVAVTLDKAGHRAQLYVNGKPAGTAKMTQTLPVVLDSTFTVGKRETDPTANFDGGVDNVLLYGRTLTSAEVAALADGQAPQRAAPTFSAAEAVLKKRGPAKTARLPDRQLTTVAASDFPANPVEKAGYRLTRQDEFSGPTLDEKLWIPYYIRHRVSDEQAKANYEFRDGAIVLKVTPDKIKYNDKGMRVSSLQTYEKPDLHKPGKRKDTPNVTHFAQQFGYFEIRAKTQLGPGHCSSFWLLGVQKDSTETGEIDVFEQAGNLGPNGLAWNVYDWHDARLRPRITNMGYQNRLRVNKDLTATFNVYGLEWTPTEVRFYFNNQLTHTIPKSPQYPMGVFLSLYEGNDWFGNIELNHPYPKEFAIDYFRAYQRK